MRLNGMWSFAHNQGYPKRLMAGFVFVAIIASAVSTLLLLDRFRSYEANIDLLVTSKSIEGAIEAPATRDTIILLGSKNEFLYAVNDAADVRGVSASSIGLTSLRLRAIADNPLDARDGVVAASQELFSSIGKFYDIRSNIAVRSVGTPVTVASIEHPILLIVLGIICGLVSTGALFGVILAFARLAFSVRTKKMPTFSEPVFPSEFEEVKKDTMDIPPVFSPDTFVPKKIENKFFSFEPSGVEREKDYAHFNRGPAPANLPIAMDGGEALPAFLMPMMEEKTETHDVEESIPTISPMIEDTPNSEYPKDREPTAEEYKRRLNELLSGKMPS